MGVIVFRYCEDRDAHIEAIVGEGDKIMSLQSLK